LIEFCERKGLGDEAFRNIDRFCMARKSGLGRPERSRAAGAAQ
jgi:hypothetical protein